LFKTLVYFQQNWSFYSSYQPSSAASLNIRRMEFSKFLKIILQSFLRKVCLKWILKLRLPFLWDHWYIIKVDCSRHISLQRIQFNKTKQNKTTSSQHKQDRVAYKAGGPTRQVALQGRWAYKVGSPTRLVGLEGRWDYKASGPTRQVSLKAGRQATRQARQVNKCTQFNCQ